MLIQDILFEAGPVSDSSVAKQSAYKTIAVMPGRYQPPHIGHLQMWQWLTDKFGDAYIATSDKVDPPRSPFNFAEKKSMFMHAGVPADHIINVKNPYVATEIVSKYPMDSTVVVFAISEKDMAESPRFAFKPKKDGSPSYLQSYKENMGDLKPQSEHAYIATVPTFKFNVNGSPMKSATEFRANFAQADDSTQAKMITDLYGTYSDQVHALMKAKIV